MHFHGGSYGSMRALKKGATGSSTNVNLEHDVGIILFSLLYSENPVCFLVGCSGFDMQMFNSFE